MYGLCMALLAIKIIALVGFIVFDQASFGCQNITGLVRGVWADHRWGIHHMGHNVNLFLCKEMIVRRINILWLELFWA